MAEAQGDTTSRAKTEFLAHFSHDLRGPLNAIIGFAEVLELEMFGPHTNPKYKQYAGDIRESGLHLLQVIEDMLEIARVGIDEPHDQAQGPTGVAGSPLDVASLGLDEFDLDKVAKSQLDQPNLTVLIAGEDHSFIRSFTIRCKEIGLNLETVSSGREAVSFICNEAHDLLILDVDLLATDKLSVWNVLEQGGWSAPSPVIFLTDRLDVESIRRIESLGAPYVRKGIDAMYQLRRTICELLGIEDSVEGARGALSESIARPVGSANSPKVLIIDDDPHVSQIIGIRLQALGVAAIRAFNGMEALGMVLREQPDVIITDYTMPKGSGEYVLTRLRSMPGTKDIPVIVLTGWTVGGKKDHSLARELLGRLGAVAYLTKPLDFDALLAELGRYIEIPASPSAIPTGGVVTDTLTRA